MSVKLKKAPPDAPEEKYMTLRDALEFLRGRGFKRSLGWIRLEVVKNNVRSFKFHSSRVVLAKDVVALADSLK